MYHLLSSKDSQLRVCEVFMYLTGSETEVDN